MEAYFDSAGHPSLSTDGFHALVCAYDRRGNMIESSFLGLHMEPVEYANFWKKTYEYNDLGQLVVDRFFDKTGKKLGNRYFRYDRNGAPIDTVLERAE